MNTRSLRFASVAAALLAIGASLSAQGRGPGFGHGQCAQRGEGRGFMGLNLSGDQQAKVQAIHENHRAAFKAKEEAANAARLAVHEAMVTGTADTKTLKALHEKATAAQFELMLEHRAVRQEILPLLTAEQKTQFEKRPMDMMGHRGGRGMGRGFGPRSGGMGPDCHRMQPS